MASDYAESAVFDLRERLGGLAASDKARLVPSEVPEIATAEKLLSERRLAKQEARRTTNERVVNIEERGFDLGWLVGVLRHPTSLERGIG